jgi:hypothetical protein
MKRDLERLERLAELEAQRRERSKQRLGSHGAASSVRRLAICSSCGKTRERGEGEPPTYRCAECTSGPCAET